LRVSPTTKWRVAAGESVKPAAWCALVIEVSRRPMVPDANLDARSAMSRATDSGVEGRVLN
jgi:hypothetical protein